MRLFGTNGRPARWRYALALMCLVVAVGVLGYMLLADLDFVQALYMALATVTTTGFDDIAQARTTHSVAVRVFTCGLMIFGIGGLAYAFSVFLGALIEGELKDAIGVRRTKRRVRFMKDHYIVCGFGRMGQLVAQTIRDDNIPVVIIDVDPQTRPVIEEMGCTCLIGDATHDDTLREASIDKARAVITVTASDPENLFVTLSARQLNPDLKIISRAVSPEAETKLLRAGANRVILPYKTGALQIAQAALRPNVVEFIDIATRTSHLDIEIEEIPVEQSSSLDGKALREATILRDLGLIVIGIKPHADGEMRFNPSADTEIHAGDTLIVLGDQDKLARLRSAAR